MLEKIVGIAGFHTEKSYYNHIEGRIFENKGVKYYYVGYVKSETQSISYVHQNYNEIALEDPIEKKNAVFIRIDSLDSQGLKRMMLDNDVLSADVIFRNINRNDIGLTSTIRRIEYK
jgi:hypothetical protein